MIRSSTASSLFRRKNLKPSNMVIISWWKNEKTETSSTIKLKNANDGIFKTFENASLALQSVVWSIEKMYLKQTSATQSHTKQKLRCEVCVHQGAPQWARELCAASGPKDQVSPEDMIYKRSNCDARKHMWSKNRCQLMNDLHGKMAGEMCMKDSIAVRSVSHNLRSFGVCIGLRVIKEGQLHHTGQQCIRAIKRRQNMNVHFEIRKWLKIFVTNTHTHIHARTHTTQVNR